MVLSKAVFVSSNDLPLQPPCRNGATSQNISCAGVRPGSGAFALEGGKGRAERKFAILRSSGEIDYNPSLPTLESSLTCHRSSGSGTFGSRIYRVENRLGSRMLRETSRHSAYS